MDRALLAGTAVWRVFGRHRGTRARTSPSTTPASSSSRTSRAPRNACWRHSTTTVTECRCVLQVLDECLHRQVLHNLYVTILNPVYLRLFFNSKLQVYANSLLPLTSTKSLQSLPQLYLEMVNLSFYRVIVFDLVHTKYWSYKYDKILTLLILKPIYY